MPKLEDLVEAPTVAGEEILEEIPKEINKDYIKKETWVKIGERTKVLREEGKVSEEKARRGETMEKRTGSKLKGEWSESGGPK